MSSSAGSIRIAGAMPMPYQSLLSETAIRAAERAAEAGDPAARELVTYFVGQGVGLVEQIRPAAQVVQDFKEDFADAMTRMMGLVEE